MQGGCSNIDRLWGLSAARGCRQDWTAIATVIVHIGLAWSTSHSSTRQWSNMQPVSLWEMQVFVFVWDKWRFEGFFGRWILDFEVSHVASTKPICAQANTHTDTQLYPHTHCKVHPWTCSSQTFDTLLIAIGISVLQCVIWSWSSSSSSCQSTHQGCNNHNLNRNLNHSTSKGHVRCVTMEQEWWSLSVDIWVFARHVWMVLEEEEEEEAHVWGESVHRVEMWLMGTNFDDDDHPLEPQYRTLRFAKLVDPFAFKNILNVKISARREYRSSVHHFFIWVLLYRCSRDIFSSIDEWRRHCNLIWNHIRVCAAHVPSVSLAPLEDFLKPYRCPPPQNVFLRWKNSKFSRLCWRSCNCLCISRTACTLAICCCIDANPSWKVSVSFCCWLRHTWWVDI